MELRLKQLEKTKAYRDGLSGLKENVFVQRKRVIIAPKMATVGERGGNISSQPTVSAQRALESGKETTGSGYFNGKTSHIFDVRFCPGNLIRKLLIFHSKISARLGHRRLLIIFWVKTSFLSSQKKILESSTNTKRG